MSTISPTPVTSTTSQRKGFPVKIIDPIIKFLLAYLNDADFLNVILVCLSNNDEKKKFSPSLVYLLKKRQWGPFESHKSSVNKGKQPTLYATYYGHLKLVKYLVKNGVTMDVTGVRYRHHYSRVINHVLDQNKTPLIHASEKGYTDLALYLVGEQKVNVNVKDDYGYTALAYALRHGHIDIVKYLLDNGATISGDKVETEEPTPLSIATRNGHLNLVKYLVEERGAKMDGTFEDGNMTLLMYASCNGYLDIVKYLVEKGVKIDTSFEVNCHIYDDRDESRSHREFSTALIHAVKNDHLHIVQYLVEKGAKINDDAFSYINPVVFAAHLNNTEIVKYLVENGADFISWEGNREYDTPVISALKHNNLDMVKCIVEKEIISKDKWGSILYQACYDGFQNHEIVKYLHYHDVGMNKREFDELIEYTNDAFLEQRW